MFLINQMDHEYDDMYIYHVATYTHACMHLKITVVFEVGLWVLQMVR